MAEILSINGAEVKIGEDSGKVITTPIATLSPTLKLATKLRFTVMVKPTLSNVRKVHLSRSKASAQLISMFLFGLELSCLADLA